MSTMPRTGISFTVRPAPDSRPPAYDVPLLSRWTEPSADQPALPLDSWLPRSAALAGHLVAPAALDSVVPLLDAEQWSAALALAVFETLHGRRPVGQLTRWVDDRVQSAIAFHRRRVGTVTSGRPAVLLSVRVQHPRPDAAEVCAHLALAGRSYALALRLDIWADRWLCTALSFG
jgi:hypothetical protein